MTLVSWSLVVALAQCGGPSVAPTPPAASDRVVVERIGECPDGRNGISGFVQYRIVDGPHRGEIAELPYGEAAGRELPEAATFGAGRIQSVRRQPGWPNACSWDLGSGGEPERQVLTSFAPAANLVDARARR